MIFKNHGEDLTKEELQEIADNFFISRHAKEMFSKRGYLNPRQIILNPYIAYFNTDGTINIAFNEYRYLVVGWAEKYQKFCIITWKEPSWTGASVTHKRELARTGKKR